MAAEHLELPPRIALLGMRGCGKSSVGALLAGRLGWEFIDTDTQIELAAGSTITEIFARRGEPAFRALEQQALEAALAGARRVISIGGGAVLYPENRARLRALALGIWLTASPEELSARLTADPRTPASRPALTSAGTLDEIRSLLAQRAPLYAELATYTIPTGGRTLADVTEEILAHLAPAPGDPLR